STAPTTQIGIATGDLGIAGYRVGYSTRTRAGLGFSLLADWNSIDGNPVATTTSFASTDLWLKADYAPPSGRLGASLQLLSSSWHRKGESGRVDDWRQERRDRVAVLSRRAPRRARISIDRHTESYLRGARYAHSRTSPVPDESRAQSHLAAGQRRRLRSLRVRRRTERARSRWWLDAAAATDTGWIPAPHNVRGRPHRESRVRDRGGGVAA